MLIEGWQIVNIFAEIWYYYEPCHIRWMYITDYRKLSFPLAYTFEGLGHKTIEWMDEWMDGLRFDVLSNSILVISGR